VGIRVVKIQGRKYFAAPIRLFYLKLYRVCNEWPRNFYEVIQEDSPCRLYFDLEYKKQFNEDTDSDLAMEQFIQVVIEVIDELFRLRLDRNTSFVILDSSNDDKFSSHVIVHMPEGALFPSNLSIKPLVHYICRQMIEKQVGLVQSNEEGGKALLCDIAVYTRNRNFRLHRSSKCGKRTELKVSHLCRFYDGREYSNANIFLDSLVVPRDYSCSSVLVMPEVLETVSTKRPIPASSVEKSLGSCLRSLNPVFDVKSPVDEVTRGCGPSPFPDVDNYMLSVFRKLNPLAEIRVWCLTVSKMYGGRSIQYQLNNCRYCYNMGREHKSQNVYWIVDLDRYIYYQRCFDLVDCPKFESLRWCLPEDLVEKVLERVRSTF